MFFLGIFFLGLWLAGLVTSYTMGGFIHVLAILASMALLSCLIRGGNSKRLAELTASSDASGAASRES
jgi:hypothetical protein